jgi:hypothetical protein
MEQASPSPRRSAARRTLILFRFPVRERREWFGRVRGLDGGQHAHGTSIRLGIPLERPYNGCSPPSMRPPCGLTASRSVPQNPNSPARWPTPWVSPWPDSAEHADSYSGAPDDQVGEGGVGLRTC